MDGVLVDFDAFLKTLSAKARADEAQMWAEIQAIDNAYQKMVPTPYARRLWNAIAETGLTRKILTALPRITSIPSAEADKNAWVDHYREQVFGGERPDVLIGPYLKDKWRHARPGDILVDDRVDNCVAWTTAGGTAIYHEGDVTKTIALLKLAVVEGK
jgi:hypothetical protein